MSRILLSSVALLAIALATSRDAAAQDTRIPISSLPRVIKKPGSYYLTQDLTGVAGNHGIVIKTSNVTVDLNGYSLIGASDALDGIMVKNASSNVAILNGSVTG